MRPNWKKISFIIIDCILAVYLVMAITAFNKPKDKGDLCESVVIDIADGNTNGFLSPEEIRQILVDNKAYPKNKPISRINTRTIEEILNVAPFINTAQCYKTIGGKVLVEITQLTPLIRIKSENGDDYYIDNMGRIMPNSKYTSDLIIVTGNVDKAYAQEYITPMAQYIMADEFWSNQIEQINVIQDGVIEFVPRVGNHIIKIGKLPVNKDQNTREQEITKMLQRKLTRLDKFYRYGLKRVGWNKYDYINLEFDNQIICRHDEMFGNKEYRYHKTSIEKENLETKKDTANINKPSETEQKNNTQR